MCLFGGLSQELKGVAYPGCELGLPDLPYFTGAPVFQAVSPASRLKPIRGTFSPVF